jgi:hypothetical protein
MNKTLIILVIVIFGFFSVTSAEENKKGEWLYFTQGKNITNLNTQLPAQKGLLAKQEEGTISIGNYKETKDIRVRHQRVEIAIEMKKKVLKLSYLCLPGESSQQSKLPANQKFFHETIESFVYLAIPKNLILLNQSQSIVGINNSTEERVELMACDFEDTEFSDILRKVNAVMEKTYELTPDDRNQMERFYDNLAGKTGKWGQAAKWIKIGVNYDLNKQEKIHMKALQKKYGKNYLIYKVPIYVPEGISMTYTHIGRQCFFTFDLSKKNEDDKIFIEIPSLSFEINIPGATRRASLENLIYEAGLSKKQLSFEDSFVNFSKEVFEAFKIWDEEKLFRLKALNKDNAIDRFYLYPKYKDKMGLFDFSKRFSGVKRHELLNAMSEQEKIKIDNEIEVKLQRYNNRDLKEEHDEYIKYLKLYQKDNKIHMKSANYLYSYGNIGKRDMNATIVFSTKDGKYEISAYVSLLPTGWKLDSIWYLTEYGADCGMATSERKANFFPGKSQKELNKFKRRHTDKVLDFLKKEIQSYYSTNKPSPNGINLYNVFNISRGTHCIKGFMFSGSASMGAIDGWGQYIEIKQFGDGKIKLISKGPDKKRNTEDDLNIQFSLEKFGYEVDAAKNIRDLDKGLVAYYPFNGNANDESGNGNNGTLNGGLSFTEGKFAQALIFNGIDGFIDLTNENGLRLSSPFTVSVWVKTDFNSGGKMYALMCPFGKHACF